VSAPSPADLPGGGDPRLHVCFVCSGNICRSPIGEQVLRSAITDAGLDDQVRVSSAGTGDWHVGQGANQRAVRVLRAAGYRTDHRARQITAGELAGIDLVLAADRGHLRDLRRMTSDHTKIALLRSFDPDADDDEVPDPYYGPDSGFDEVLAMTQAAVPGVVAEIRRLLHQRHCVDRHSSDRTSGTPAGSGR
jgi:protein-tyrosine phosphatase